MSATLTSHVMTLSGALADGSCWSDGFNGLVASSFFGGPSGSGAVSSAKIKTLPIILTENRFDVDCVKKCE